MCEYIFSFKNFQGQLLKELLIFANLTLKGKCIHLLKFCIPVFDNSLFQLVEWYMLACYIIYRELGD